MGQTTPGQAETEYYRVLQVDPAAEPGVIEAAYRRLAAKCHPNVDPSAEAGARMRELNAAWELLREPERRGEYDRRRSARTLSMSAPRLRLDLPSAGIVNFCDLRQVHGGNEVWIGVGNEGAAPLHGQVVASADWLSVQPASFVVPPGQRLLLAARLHPERVLDPACARGCLRIATSGGSVTVPVVTRPRIGDAMRMILGVLLALVLLFALAMRWLVLV